MIIDVNFVLKWWWSTMIMMINNDNDDTACLEAEKIWTTAVAHGGGVFNVHKYELNVQWGKWWFMLKIWSTAAHGGMFNVHQYECSTGRMFINTNWASTHELNWTCYTIWCWDVISGNAILAMQLLWKQVKESQDKKNTSYTCG